MSAPNPSQKTYADSADVILTHPLAEKDLSAEIIQTENNNPDLPVFHESHIVNEPKLFIGGNQGRLPTPKWWLSQALLFFTPTELQA